MCGVKLSGDKKLTALLADLKKELENIYGDHLKDVILYGSYARGKNDPESDIDIMVLVDLDALQQGKYRDILAEKVTEISIKYNALITVIDSNDDDFRIRSSYIPFYKNVLREGVRVCGLLGHRN